MLVLIQFLTLLIEKKMSVRMYLDELIGIVTAIYISYRMVCIILYSTARIEIRIFLFYFK